MGVGDVFRRARCRRPLPLRHPGDVRYHRPAPPQEALAASERRFRELLEALPAAVYTTDAAGRVTFYNQAAVELAGCAPQTGSDAWWRAWRLYRPDGTPLPSDNLRWRSRSRKIGRCPARKRCSTDRTGTRVPFIVYPTAVARRVGRVDRGGEHAGRYQRAQAGRGQPENAARRAQPSGQEQYADAARAAARGATRDAKRGGAGGACRCEPTGRPRWPPPSRWLYDAGNPITYRARRFLEGVCASARQAFTTATSTSRSRTVRPNICRMTPPCRSPHPQRASQPTPPSTGERPRRGRDQGWAKQGPRLLRAYGRG